MIEHPTLEDSNDKQQLKDLNKLSLQQTFYQKKQNVINYQPNPKL